MITRKDIRESIKDREDRELWFGLEYPCSVTVERLSWMRPESTSWYIEQLVSDAGNWDAFYYLTTYDSLINKVVMIHGLSYSYKVENEEDIVDLIEEFEEIYEAYMDKSKKMFLAYINYKDAKDRN